MNLENPEDANSLSFTADPNKSVVHDAQLNGKNLQLQKEIRPERIKMLGGRVRPRGGRTLGKVVLAQSLAVRRAVFVPSRGR